MERLKTEIEEKRRTPDPNPVLLASPISHAGRGVSLSRRNRRFAGRFGPEIGETGRASRDVVTMQSPAAQGRRRLLARGLLAQDRPTQVRANESFTHRKEPRQENDTQHDARIREVARTMLRSDGDPSSALRSKPAREPQIVRGLPDAAPALAHQLHRFRFRLRVWFRRAPLHLRHGTPFSTLLSLSAGVHKTGARQDWIPLERWCCPFDRFVP
jgi:hypothetical protein